MSDSISPELARLQNDVGDWNAEITVTPQPGAAPQASTGRLTGRLISGGRWLVLDFKNHTTGFEGHGLYGFNPASGRYVGTWVDDMRTNLYLGEGDWDSATSTMTYHWKAAMPDGRNMAWRETTKRISDNEKEFRVVFSSPDGSEFEMMRAIYRRA
jgi:Protein of unknown function (DUF1579)